MRFARLVLVSATVVAGLAAFSGAADAAWRRGRVLVPRRGPVFVTVPAPRPVFAPPPVYYRAPRVYVYSDRYYGNRRSARRYHDDGGDWFGRTRRRAERYFFDPNPSAGLGASVSGWKPNDADVTDALLRAHLRAYLTPNAALQGEVGWWRHTFDDPTTGQTSELRDIPAGASLLLIFRPNGGGFGFGRQSSTSLGIYGGLGVDWHTWREEIPSTTPGTTVVDEATGFGYHYVAGVELGPRRGANLFGEFRYNVGDLQNLNGRKFDFTGPAIGGGIAVNF